MARIVQVVTTSMATLEAYAPPYNLRQPDPADNMKLGLSMLEAAGQQGADLACLPEGFVAAGLPGSALRGLAEPIPGPRFDAVADCARRHGMYVVAGFYTQNGDGIDNVAVLIDRKGALVGTYSKKHPTEGEMAAGVRPGPDARVFQTDFGRVGLAICFDVNWQPLWESMKAQGAELICWISAYEGGFPLQANAWLHQVPVVTSVWPYHARVIDRMGRVVAQTSRWNRLATYSLDLDKRYFHTDDHADRLLPIQARYGSRLKLEAFTEEHVFSLESTDPTLSIENVIREFGIVEYDAYIARCTQAQNSGRGQVTGHPPSASALVEA